MKRLLSIITLVCAICTCAEAQWYLFPGNGKKQTEERKGPEKTEKKNQQKAPGQTTETAVPQIDSASITNPADTLTVPKDDFILDIPQTINVTMFLPLKSTGKPSDNFYEYYTGALLAASDLGREGIDINLNIYDTGNGGINASQSVIDASDVIIGPVSSSDIKTLLQKIPEGKFVVSPLEPKAAALTDNERVIQVPATAESQVEEIVRWLKEEATVNDAVIVIEDEKAPGGNSRLLLDKLEASGIRHSVIRTSTVDDLQLARRTRFVVASDDEQFLCSTVNNIANLAAHKSGIVLYGTSKLRAYNSIHSESLYKANTRLTSNYFVDYSDAEVKDFIMRFRAVFHSEPSSFAFHGYDTFKYFVTACATYGRQWPKRLSECSECGLQADFKFEKQDGLVGMINSSVRRIIYYPDLTATVQK